MNLFLTLTGLLFPILLACHSTLVGTDPPGRKLVWSDEFNYTGRPDTTKWQFEVGGNGFGNHELQYYTNRPENARVEQGSLIIEARKEAYQTQAYTSAKLTTRTKTLWKKGRFEIRAKLPAGAGTWPAIWMLNAKPQMQWPLDGEIDIMEHVGYDEGVIHGTVHTGAYNHVQHTQKGGELTVADATQTFHIYAIDWQANQIDFYVDDKKYYTFDKKTYGDNYAQWPFMQDFYLILNVAIGGDWGGQKGVNDSIFPQRMEVDYVRVYD